MSHWFYWPLLSGNTDPILYLIHAMLFMYYPLCVALDQCNREKDGDLCHGHY